MRELGKVHPAFLGGAYLPPGEPGDVEIARLESRSTTADVLSLRARVKGGGISYELVDEYEVAWVLPIPFSGEPLTMRELFEELDGAHPTDDPDFRGLTIAWRQRLLDGGGREEALELVDFLTITSGFYPRIGEEDRRRALAWADSVPSG
jgi:hypothetical protein